MVAVSIRHAVRLNAFPHRTKDRLPLWPVLKLFWQCRPVYQDRELEKNIQSRWGFVFQYSLGEAEELLCSFEFVISNAWLISKIK